MVFKVIKSNEKKYKVVLAEIFGTSPSNNVEISLHLRYQNDLANWLRRSLVDIFNAT